MKEKESIYISITFDGDNKLYEDIKSYEDIKKQQTYFEDYSLEEIYDELNVLISKNNFELNRNHEQILFNVVLGSIKKKTLDFILEIKKSENNIINNVLFQQIIKQKDEVIKKQDEIIKQKDEIIKEKNDIIKDLREIIKKNNYVDNAKTEKTNNKEKKEDKKLTNKDNKDYNEIFKDFNIINHTPKNKLTNHGNKSIYTILQLQDGRLASGGNDGSIIIYNKQTFTPELTIKEHQDSVFDIIQLKNGNLLSCSHDDKTMKEYKLNENNTYQVLSTVNVGEDKDNYPRQIVELENNEIGLIAENNIIFYLNINNKLDEDFKIKSNDNQIGQYYEMLPVKPGELVITGNKDKIQFFELNTRKLKEIININRDIRWKGIVLCMINERCLCVGGANKITLIDVYNKNIISEVEESGTHRCLYKLNDNILLIGKDSDITQWRINGNNLTFVNKKEKAHQDAIREIIRFNNFLISCSDDNSIKIW